MPHHPADETAANPAHNSVLASLEPAAPPSSLIELHAIAADANELVSRIHAGQGTDLGELIRRSIDERPVQGPDERPGELAPETLKTAA
ncbi:MAG: hypothetical protein ACF8Q5_08180 [Phycisphaerales bacterium JB040]